MEFVIACDPELLSRESGGEHERNRGLLRVLSGSLERRIMVQGAVFLGLITLLPAAPSSAKTGRVRTDLPLPNVLAISLFLIFLLCRFSSSFFCLPVFFISLPITHMFFFSPALSSSSSEYTQTRTRTHTHSSSFDHQAVSALIWINWQQFHRWNLFMPEHAILFRLMSQENSHFS